MQMNLDSVIASVTKIFNDNYELNKKNIELEAENAISKDKIKKLTQGNKTKQEQIDTLQKKIQSLERKLNIANSINLINDNSYCSTKSKLK